MKKVFSIIGFCLLAALAGCDSDKSRDEQPDADPVKQRERTLKQSIKEMKARNKEEDKKDREARKHNQYNVVQHTETGDTTGSQPSVGQVTPVVDQPQTAQTGTTTQPAPTALTFTQAQPGAKFYIVITCANNYPGCELRGCDNDGSDMDALGRWYADKVGISTDRVIVVHLTDGQYSTANALKALTDVVNALKVGDYFLYWNSGHGAEYAGKDTSVDPDGLNQVICPQDFDWSEEHMITDKQLHAIFSKIPKGVIGNWGSDSCHSGDLTKAFPTKRVYKYKSYPLPPPPAVAIQLAKARAQGKTRSLNSPLNICYISGCRYNEFSADLQDDNGRPCGGLTWSFRTQLAKNYLAPMTTVTANVNIDLDSLQLGQHPQLEGPADEVKRPFLQPAH